MRLNKYLAHATGMGRRSADKAIEEGRVMVNGVVAEVGQQVGNDDKILLDSSLLQADSTAHTIILNKPVGYVCSREGQGSKTIYDLLPPDLHHLKPVGRLDKDSSGLLLLTSDGDLSNRLTHPKYQKTKVYEITLDKDLSEADFETITKDGVRLEDGTSRLGLDFMNDGNTKWQVTMHEGRNRQIRRTFAALGYVVTELHRTRIGDYMLNDLRISEYKETA